MARKFIKTIYIPTRKYANDEVIPERIDLYETDCFIIYKTTTIRNEVYERKDKKESSWYKYSTAKKYLETEFDQNLCDEFEGQSKEYRKQAVFKAEQSKAEKGVKSRMLLFTGALHNKLEKFKGDWVEFEKKIKVKTEEMYQDFLKFMNDNNK